MNNDNSNTNLASEAQAPANQDPSPSLSEMTATDESAQQQATTAVESASNGVVAQEAADAPARSQPVEQQQQATDSAQVAVNLAPEQACAEPEAAKPEVSAASETAATEAAETLAAAAQADESAPKEAQQSDQGGAQEQQQQQQPPSKTTEEASRCNLTLVLHEKLRMELEQRPLPGKPKPDEVQLATHTVGICGSDVKYWQCGKIGNFVLTKPMILGHETSAIVMEVGQNVTTLQPGDKVAVEVGLPCSSCQLCRQGKYNLCSQMAFAATPPYDGTLTRYFNHPASFCFKLPEAVSLEEGALLEPMAVAVHACKRAPIRLGDVVLVCGAGAVGLLSMLCAKAFGASHVIITDISEARLKFAKKIGASETILIERHMKPTDVAAIVRQFVQKVKPSSDGVEVVLECSGAESSMHLAIHSAAVGAQIVCVGCQADQVTIPLVSAVMQEIDIKGVFRYRNCYPIAMSLVESGKINLRPLITHRFCLEQSVDAFEACSKGEGVKILIKCMDDKLNLDNSNKTN